MSIIQQQQQQIKNQSYINSSNSGHNSSKDKKRDESYEKPGGYKGFNDQVNDDNYYVAEEDQKNSFAIEKKP